MGWDVRADEKHKSRSLNGVSTTFNDHALERSFMGHAADNGLSEYDREAKAEMNRVEFHNPLGAISKPLLSINPALRKLIERLKGDKEDFLDLLIVMSIQQMQERIEQLLEDIQQLIAEMEELRDKMLKQLEEHQELLDGAQVAMKNGHYNLDDGNFKNPYLRLMVDRYTKRNGLYQSELQDMTIEQLRAMVLDEIDIVEYEYQELSTQTGIISRQIENLYEIKDTVKQAQDVLGSDLPDHVKQQQVREVMNGIDLTDIENQLSLTKFDIDQMSKAVEQEEVNRIESNKVFSKPDSLFSSI